MGKGEKKRGKKRENAIDRDWREGKRGGDKKSKREERERKRKVGKKAKRRKAGK